VQGAAQQEFAFASDVVFSTPQHALSFALAIGVDFVNSAPQHKSQSSQHSSHPTEQEGQGMAQQGLLE